jgi:hypothetical protein
MPDEKKPETKPRKLPLEKTDDLAEGERDRIEEDLRQREQKKDRKS